MAQNYASSIGGVALRVTRLQADGSYATGPSASYVLTGDFISLSFTPEYAEGEDMETKGADGGVCVAYKAPDTLKRVTLELSVCNPDPELSEILTGGTLLTDAGTSVGWAAPEIGVDGNPYGASIEVWTRAVVGGKLASVNPYWRWVFPFTTVRPGGDRAIENGVMANTFEGQGVGNAAWGTGPDEGWPFTSERAFAYARTDSAPLGLRGYQTVPVV